MGPAQMDIWRGKEIWVGRVIAAVKPRTMQEVRRDAVG